MPSLVINDPLPLGDDPRWRVFPPGCCTPTGQFLAGAVLVSQVRDGRPRFLLSSAQEGRSGDWSPQSGCCPRLPLRSISYFFQTAYIHSFYGSAYFPVGWQSTSPIRSRRCWITTGRSYCLYQYQSHRAVHAFVSSHTTGPVRVPHLCLDKSRCSAHGILLRRSAPIFAESTAKSVCLQS